MKTSKLPGWKERLKSLLCMTGIIAGGVFITAYLFTWKTVSYFLIAVVWIFVVSMILNQIANHFYSMRLDSYYQSKEANIQTILKCLRGHHNWNQCFCTVCGEIRSDRHQWDGCRCTICGAVRDEGHDWDGCICQRCGRDRHLWDDGICRKCGEICYHSWVTVYEDNYGEMDYSSYGGGVEEYVVTLSKCCLCGKLRKEGRGDFCGDPSELLEITEKDIARSEKI